MSEEKEIVVGDYKMVQQSEPQQNVDCMSLISYAVQNGADIQKLERLMDLQERYETREAEKAFNLAMANFQREVPVIEKNGLVNYQSGNGVTCFAYAKLEDIAKAIKEPMSNNNLSYRFSQSQQNGSITVKCVLTHTAGHTESAEMTAPPDASGKKDPIKAVASTLTYLRRYTLMAVAGIVVGGEDDDGNSGEQESWAQEQAPGEGGNYSNEKFAKSFPAWAQQIKSGKKTAGEIELYLFNKGVALNKEQLQQLRGVK